MEQLKVSVVIATYNRAPMLKRALDSIFGQTLQDFEIIVVDDCSTDDTQSMVNDLGLHDSRIHYFRTRTNAGPGIARNQGIAEASGHLIAILDDDDVSVPDRLETQWKLLCENPEIDLVFSPVQWVDENQEPIHVFPGRVAAGTFPKDPREVFQLLYLESNKIPNTTLCYRRELWIEGKWINGKFRKFSYPIDPRVGEDWFVVMQLSACGVRMMYTQKPLVLQQRGKSHISLMRKTEYAFKAQQHILGMTRQWLKTEKITEFEKYHRLAVSNQLLREARARGGFVGIGLCLRAWAYSPLNKKVYQNLSDLSRRGMSRVGL